jgi:uroporphyrinogen-III synthase
MARMSRISSPIERRRTPPDSPAAQAIYRMLLDGKVDAVTFASPSAVQRFAALIGPEQAADLLNTTVVAAIGR